MPTETPGKIKRNVGEPVILKATDPNSLCKLCNLCINCGKEKPPVAIFYNDEFCSTMCCRAYNKIEFKNTDQPNKALSLPRDQRMNNNVVFKSGRNSKPASTQSAGTKTWGHKPIPGTRGILRDT